MTDGAGNEGTGTDREGTIRDRAYAIWQEEGQPEGQGADHWHRAESEMGGDGAVPADSAPSMPAANAKTDDTGPLTKLKKKTAKVVKSL